MGYYDAHHKRPLMLTLRDQAIADAALEGKPEPYRRLDTAVLEALILKGALGMTEDDISHFNGLDYARTTEQAREQVDSGEADAAFFMTRHAGRAGPRRGRRRGEHAAEVDLLLPEGADRHGVQSPGGDGPDNRSAAVSGAMRRSPQARALHPRRARSRKHRITADEPEDRAGRTWARARRSCSPPRWPRARRSRWRCTPSARAGTSTASRSTAATSPPSAAASTRFELIMKMPAHLSDEQVEQAAGDRRQVPCAPHARGRSGLRRTGRAHLSSLRDELSAVLLAPEEALAMDVHGGARTRPSSPRSSPTTAGALHAVFTRRRDDLKRHAGEISFPGGRRDDGRDARRDRAARGPRGGRAAAGRRRRARRARPRRRPSSPTTRSIPSWG